MLEDLMWPLASRLPFLLEQWYLFSWFYLLFWVHDFLVYFSGLKGHSIHLFNRQCPLAIPEAPLT